MTGLSASALTKDSVSVTWASSAATDAESIRVVYKIGSNPSNENDGTVWSSLEATVTSDTILNLDDKTLYYIGAFVRDSSGNWSLAAAGAQDNVWTPDTTSPENVTVLNATAISSDSVGVTWTSSAATDV